MSQKLIVTHHNPDLDAITAAWLFVTFMPDEYGHAGFAFVPAGSTYKNQPVDSENSVVHVDTGKGKFDHHDKEREQLSATWIVYQYLISKQGHLKDDKALLHIAEFVTDIDHFGEYYWPDSLNPRYGFMLSSIIPSLHGLNKYSNEEVMQQVFPMLDATYQTLKDYEHAYEQIKTGTELQTKWGKGMAIESGSDGVMKVAQRMGYEVVVRKDPRTGFMKIKSAPKKEIDLKLLYDKIVDAGEKDRWYFHPGGHMLINGSSKNSEVEPTRLSLDDIVKLISK